MDFLTQHRINYVPYLTNAELSVLEEAFIDDNERNLMFRLYIPTGRLYANEADKLLSLFREWLNQLGRHVRQDGYSTTAGHVYEFFGTHSSGSYLLSRDLDEFSLFLEQCISAPHRAEEQLVKLGLPKSQTKPMVTRFGREARRIQIDVKYERDSKILALRHELESQLIEVDNRTDTLTTSMIGEMLDTSARAIIAGELIPTESAGYVTFNINQQVIQTARATIVQSIQGTSELSDEAKLLLSLISQHGGERAIELETAVHELEDEDARAGDRITARSTLKKFLLSLGKQIEAGAFGILQKYIEAKIGLS